MKEALRDRSRRQAGLRNPSSSPSQSENANQVPSDLDFDSDLEYLLTLGGHCGNRNRTD